MSFRWPEWEDDFHIVLLKDKRASFDPEAHNACGPLAVRVALPFPGSLYLQKFIHDALSSHNTKAIHLQRGVKLHGTEFARMQTACGASQLAVFDCSSTSAKGLFRSAGGSASDRVALLSAVLACAELRRLRLGDIAFGSGGVSLCAALGNQLPASAVAAQLVSFQMSGGDLSDAACCAPLQTALAALVSLRKLEIAYSGVRSETFCALLAGVSEAAAPLASLCMDGCPIGADGFEALVEQPFVETLVHLSLWRCNENGVGADSQSHGQRKADAIARLLARAPKLVTLVVGQSLSAWPHACAVLRAAQSEPLHGNWEIFDVGLNSSAGDGAALVSRAHQTQLMLPMLTENSMLVELGLRLLRIDEETAQLFCEAIEQHQYLQKCQVELENEEMQMKAKSACIKRSQ